MNGFAILGMETIVELSSCRGTMEEETDEGHEGKGVRGCKLEVDLVRWGRVRKTVQPFQREWHVELCRMPCCSRRQLDAQKDRSPSCRRLF